MADKYVKASGSNTSPYDTWAKAATSLQTAIGAVAAGEKIYVDSAFSENLAADTTYNPASNFVEVISTSDTTNQPPTTYAAGATANGNANGVDVNVSRGAWFGYSFLTGVGGTANSISIGNLSADVVHLEDCTLSVRSTNAGGAIILGVGIAGASRFTTKGCSFIFGAVGQGFSCRTVNWEDQGSVFVPSGSIPTNLFEFVDRGSFIRINGGDFSAFSGSLYSASVGNGFLWLSECELHASTNIPTALTIGDGFECLLTDCHSGDTHYYLQHVTYRGTTVASTSVVMNTSDAAKYDGTNAYSWRVIGNSNTTYAMPYCSPWIDVYHSGTAAITPRVEIERDDSTSAFTDRQIWIEVMAKTTSGSTLSTLYSSRAGPLATAANVADGAGLASWTGESGTAKSMKLVAPSLTPAEIGPIRVRICVGANIDAYVNPKILDLGQTESNVERVLGSGGINTNVTTGGGSGGGLRLAGPGGLAA